MSEQQHPPLKVTCIKWKANAAVERFNPPKEMAHLPPSEEVVFVDYYTQGSDHHYCPKCFPNAGVVVDERRAPKA